MQLIKQVKSHLLMGVHYFNHKLLLWILHHLLTNIHTYTRTCLCVCVCVEFVSSFVSSKHVLHKFCHESKGRELEQDHTFALQPRIYICLWLALSKQSRKTRGAHVLSCSSTVYLPITCLVCTVAIPGFFKRPIIRSHIPTTLLYRTVSHPIFSMLRERHLSGSDLPFVFHDGLSKCL